MSNQEAKQGVTSFYRMVIEDLEAMGYRPLTLEEIQSDLSGWEQEKALLIARVWQITKDAGLTPIAVDQMSLVELRNLIEELGAQ